MPDASAKYWADPDAFAGAAYRERADEKLNAVDRFIARATASLIAWKGRGRLRSPLASAVERRGADLEGLDEAAFRALTATCRGRLLAEGFTPPNRIEALALAREATRRALGLRQRPVQIHGAGLLLDGRLLEMATGEGKTLTAALAAGAAALAGLRVHVVTVNDYLATRDHEEMSPIFRQLGLSTGLVTGEQESPERRAAYGCDITYVNNKDVTFDYLRDLLALGQRRTRARASVAAALGNPGRGAARPELILRGLDFAIVDEADSVLIDEAKTPLIISAETPGTDDLAEYHHALAVARDLVEGIDYELDRQERSIRLLPAAEATLVERTGRDGIWGVRRAREERITQALSAIHLHRKDEHYIVAEDKVQIVDEFTGRVMADRSWEAGLHQMIEAKENLPLTSRRSTIARMTYQRFFRRYRRLSGMTGTGVEVAGELAAEFALRTRLVPTHRPVQRKFLGTRLFDTTEDKFRAVVERVAALAATGRPVLIGVRSVLASETLAAMLAARAVPHVVLNARQDAEEAAIIAEAGRAGAVTVATNMAGRGTDIKLGEGVAEAGGLHVVLTEFHDSGRVDRQLYGRAGRQGDPGSCEAMVSLDDELFQKYARRWVALIRRFPVAANGERSGRVAARLGRIAQGRAERRDAEIRRITVRNEEQTARTLAFAGRPE